MSYKIYKREAYTILVSWNLCLMWWRLHMSLKLMEKSVTRNQLSDIFIHLTIMTSLAVCDVKKSLDHVQCRINRSQIPCAWFMYPGVQDNNSSMGSWDTALLNALNWDRNDHSKKITGNVVRLNLPDDFDFFVISEHVNSIIVKVFYRIDYIVIIWIIAQRK